MLTRGSRTIGRWNLIASASVMLVVLGLVATALYTAIAYREDETQTGRTPAVGQVIAESQEAPSSAASSIAGVLAGFGLLSGWAVAAIVMITRAKRRQAAETASTAPATKSRDG